VTVEYPDILGEYIGSQARFDANGLQFAGSFEPAQIASGAAGNFYLHLQNCLNVPVNVKIRTSIPQSGVFRGDPVIAFGRAELSLAMAPAEAGLVTLPFKVSRQVGEGQVKIGIELRVKPQGRSQRIRPEQHASQVPAQYFDDLVGLQLVGVLGVSYKAHKTRKAMFTLDIAGAAGEVEAAPSLKPSYDSRWKLQDWEVQRRARHEINHRRVQIQDALSMEPLFVGLYAEATRRFADCGVPLRIGEAICLAKMLTYTSRFFLESGPLQDGLLVPMWERALRSDYPTTQVIDVVRAVGYWHVTRLSVALSFGLIAEALGRQPWSLLERRALTAHISNAVEVGDTLEEAFVYLPLLLAATQAAPQIRLENEDSQHCLHLLKQAKDARSEVFADEDLQAIGQIFDQLLERNLSS
jgi:hypothetical protein